MRSRVVRLAVAALCFSCKDPLLDVSFEIPSRYAEAVTSVVLSVYDVTGPSQSCDALAWVQGDLPLPVAQVTFPPGQARLPSIPREGTKSLVAQGFDKAGDLVVAGCLGLGTIVEAASVDIPVEPAAVLALEDIDAIQFPNAGVELPATLQVDVQDYAGRSLSGRAVRATSAHPGPSANHEQQVISDGAGRAVLDLGSVAEAFGPAQVSVRVRWPRSITPVVSGFRFFDTSVQSDIVGDFPRDVAASASGPNGEAELVALVARANEDRLVLVRTRFNALAGAFVQVEESLPLVTVAASLIPAEPGRQGLYVAATNQLFENVLWSYSLGGVTETPLGGDGDVIVAANLLPGCETSARLMLSFFGGASTVYDADGTLDSAHPFTGNLGWSVESAGCILSVQGQSFQSVAFFDNADLAQQRFRKVFAAASAGSIFRGEWGTFLSPILYPGAQAAQQGVWAIQQDLAGSAVLHLEGEVAGDDSMRLVLRSSTLLPGPALAMALGDFDGDSYTDVVALGNLSDFGDTTAQQNLYFVYGKTLAGRPLVGTMPLDGPVLFNPRFVVVDYDSDGLDDIAIVGDLNGASTPITWVHSQL